MFSPAAPQDPQSIDAAVYTMARRRLVRDVVSMVVACAFVVGLFATFYKILVS
jgi:hypothetical protein